MLIEVSQPTGHHADGSGIQNHSCGGLYPYIIYAKQVGPSLSWGVLRPDGSKSLHGTYDAAVAAGELLKTLHDVLDRAYALRASPGGHLGLCAGLGLKSLGVEILIATWESWPKYSGDIAYPIRGGASAYDLENLYEGDYGRLRLELLDHLINCLEARIDGRQCATI